MLPRDSQEIALSLTARSRRRQATIGSPAAHLCSQSRPAPIPRSVCMRMRHPSRSAACACSGRRLSRKRLARRCPCNGGMNSPNPAHTAGLVPAEPGPHAVATTVVPRLIDALVHGPVYATASVRSERDLGGPRLPQLTPKRQPGMAPGPNTSHSSSLRPAQAFRATPRRRADAVVSWSAAGSAASGCARRPPGLVAEHESEICGRHGLAPRGRPLWGDLLIEQSSRHLMRVETARLPVDQSRPTAGDDHGRRCLARPRR